MTNPFETVANSFGNTLTTMMAQGQAAVQNMMGLAANMVQNASSAMQRGQSQMLGSVESVASTFVQNASKPLFPIAQMANGLNPMAQGGQEIQMAGPGGQWTGQDQGVSNAPPWQPSFSELRSEEDYARLTSDRRQYYDARYGGGGFTVSKREGEVDRGSPVRTHFF